ncbi:small-conductance mechanosensitive channel [Desulfobaculum xiamenense]|uniref:Small-conductance mechanosensitive channel n=2 Tax=Desulfobaculum xiamenense TaxID=995050 RepID=A0A846QSK4_9BACT|nr:small-conductance mechanosensitive channel [Desulfobaculum xiamenense]
MKTINETVEARLYRMGYTLRDVRILVRNQLYLAAASCIAAAGLGWMMPWLFDFAAGALLITFNFSSLARFAQHLVHKREGAISRLLLGFYGRLLLTGLALLALIAWGNAVVGALLAGLSTAVVTILIWGAAQVIGKNAKEA